MAGNYICNLVRNNWRTHEPILPLWSLQLLRQWCSGPECFLIREKYFFILKTRRATPCSSAGWISCTPKSAEIFKVKAWTPGGKGLFPPSWPTRSRDPFTQNPLFRPKSFRIDFRPHWTENVHTKLHKHINLSQFYGQWYWLFRSLIQK
jgi:hypothetical protein